MKEMAAEKIFSKNLLHKLVILFIFFQASYVYAGDTLNAVDAAGLRQGYWIVFNSIKKLPNYPTDAKVEEGNYADSKKAGIWKTYFPNGNLKGEITYTNNRASGYAKMYQENGKLMEEGVWENNRWVGEFKSYHENGQTFCDFKYTKGGKREGEQTYYYDNGQLMMKGEMKEGKEAGTWVGYYENGDKRDEKVFNDGTLDEEKTKLFEPKKEMIVKTETTATKEPAKMADAKTEKTNEAQKPFDGNGYAKLFNQNRQMSKDGTFKNFRLIDGKDYIYNTAGMLEHISFYKDGKYVGEAPIEATDK
ncbi:MAG: toxin-antitoxin system YwqK family antitoxin [Bacteroidetes bacterium]|nr:toxin-antitoxin system YwqK family antitoxin [Bacteroidota bacterium]